MLLRKREKPLSFPGFRSFFCGALGMTLRKRFRGIAVRSSAYRRSGDVVALVSKLTRSENSVVSLRLKLPDCLSRRLRYTVSALHLFHKPALFGMPCSLKGCSGRHRSSSRLLGNLSSRLLPRCRAYFAHELTKLPGRVALIVYRGVVVSSQ